MKISIEEKIVSKLEEYGIKVFDVDKINNYITAERMIISYIKNEIFINFHILSEPCYAGRIVTILHEIKNIKKFIVGDDFTFDKDGKYLEGEEANKLNEEIHKNQIINEFMEQQAQLYFLSKAEGYPC